MTINELSRSFAYEGATETFSHHDLTVLKVVTTQPNAVTAMLVSVIRPDRKQIALVFQRK